MQKSSTCHSKAIIRATLYPNTGYIDIFNKLDLIGPAGPKNRAALQLTDRVIRNVCLSSPAGGLMLELRLFGKTLRGYFTIFLSKNQVKNEVKWQLNPNQSSRE